MRFYLLFINFFIFFTAWCQQDSITLMLQDKPVRALIEQVEQQSDYFFIYQDNVIDQAPKISINVTNVSLGRILHLLEKQTNMNGVIFGNQVILTLEQKIDTVVISVHKKVSGRVLTENGRPLVGVSVLVKGTATGTLSDSLGFFELKIPYDSAKIIFSYLGRETLEVLAIDKQELNITLKNKLTLLDEVMSIGYGKVKRTESTSSIVSIKAKNLEEFPILTIEDGLKGRLAGVQIIQSSGQPGAGMSARIRGVSSIAGRNEPLYVIDGIPTSNLDVRELNGLSGFIPSDISEVDVLKDAMATSIYGSRAANGVILISTKNGTPGKMKVSYKSYFSQDKVRKKLPLMNGEEYINYATQYYTNAKNISEEQRQRYLNALTEYGNANTDWQDEIFRTALCQGHNLSFSGGSNKNSYFASLNYTNQDGIVKSTGFNQYGLRLNIKNNITDWLEISARTSFSKILQDRFLSGDGTNTHNNEKSGIGATILVPSTISVNNEKGNYSPAIAYPFSYEDLDNPVAMLDALDKSTTYNYIGGFDVKTIIFPDLSNTLRIGIEYLDRTHDYYIPSTLTQLGSQTAELEKLNRVSGLFEDYFTWRKTWFDKISVEAISGFSAQIENYQSILLSGTVFPTDNLQNSVIQAASSISTPETNKIETSIASFFSRIHMGYMNKYLLSVSIRYDGASVFSDKNKWSSFPAFALAWRISEEKFLKGTKISNLIMRTSWGLAGNQAIKPYQSLYVGKIVNTSQGSGSRINVGLTTNLPNENLTWETTEQINLGLDLGLDNDKYRLVFDYYIRNTRDLLANVALPRSSGYLYYMDNVGTVQNKGFELTIGMDFLNKDNWQAAFDLNFSKNTNIVKSTKNNQDIIPARTDDATRTSTIVRVGEPLYTFYMPRFLGLDDNGIPMYEDLNNDGIIDDSDRQTAGSPLPDFFYGFNFYTGYKNILLTLNWQGVYGVQMHNISMIMLTEQEPTGNRIKNITDYYPNVSDEYDIWNSDRFIEDASFLRLRNIRLAYELEDVNQYISDLTVYLSAQNLLTFTQYTGYDPEVNSFSDDNQFQGIDYVAFPQSKAITLGIKITF